MGTIDNANPNRNRTKVTALTAALVGVYNCLVLKIAVLGDMKNSVTEKILQFRNGYGVGPTL